MNENTNPVDPFEGIDTTAADTAFKALDRAKDLETRLAMALDLAKMMFANVHYIVPSLIFLAEEGHSLDNPQLCRMVDAILETLETRMTEFEAKYPEHEGPI